MSEFTEYDGPGRRWPQSAKIAVSSLTAAQEVAEQSVYDQVYHTLRRMILYNEIKPGYWLRQQEIAAQFRVSRTPVREAFRSLSQESLVKLVPNYGAQVVELSMEEFEEIYALRMGIEGLAARLTAEKIQPEQLPLLRDRLNQLAKLPHCVKLPVYLKEEWQFRVQCYQVTNRQRLLEQVIFLREHSERYIHLAYRVKARIDESFDFHVRLLDAIAANDGTTAEITLQNALRWTLTNAGPVVAAIINERRFATQD